MLREPRPVEKAPVPRKDPKTGRFRLVKLEERIAPCRSEKNCGKTINQHSFW